MENQKSLQTVQLKKTISKEIQTMKMNCVQMFCKKMRIISGKIQKKT
ncbi:hypothetical protein D917_00533 [Trichinella nativa]|uniref:Uncharacterized protein n=1 Tax=Trichinella nativa TaxID=6335 RepID=A0A1Y3E8J7_9BILA|nr:hypothetical protein D917_00533 [Trichinella nativa]